MLAGCFESTLLTSPLMFASEGCFCPVAVAELCSELSNMYLLNPSRKGRAVAGAVVLGGMNLLSRSVY